MKWLSYLKVYCLLVQLDIQIRFVSFQKLFELFVKQYAISDEREEISEKEIDEINQWLQIIDNVCASYPFEAQCLHRSFLGYRIVRTRFRIPVDLVIGTRKFPFYAHAWLMLKNSNFNESPEFTSSLTIILHSGEGGNAV